MGIFLRRGPAPVRMSDLVVEGTIKLNLGGTPWDWLVVHQGLPSAIYDASCNGTWLLLKDIYEQRQWHSSNVNDYANSTINSHLNGDFLQLFDPKIRNAIKQVKIPYVNGTGNSAVGSGANGLSAKIFLLSGYEVGIGGASYVPQDGAKLDYFNQDTGTDSKRIAYLNGSTAVGWWLRSPYTGNTSNAWYVSSTGYYYYRNSSNEPASRGVRPAIILPSDMIVTDDMLAA